MRFQLRSSINSKIIFMILVLLVLGIGVPIVISYVSSRKAILDITVENISKTTQISQKHLAAWIANRKTEVQTLGGFKVFQVALQDTFIGKSARVSASQQLQKTKAEQAYFVRLGIADMNGLVVAASDDQTQETSVSDQPYFQSAVAGNVALLALNFNQATQSTNFFISTPIRDENATAGVLFAQFDLGVYAKEFISDLKVGETGYFYVADQTGLVIVHPMTSNLATLNMSQYDFGKQILREGTGLVLYDWEGREKFATFDTIPSLGWVVVGSGYEEELAAQINRSTLITLFISMVILVIAGLIALVASRRISAPIVKAVEMIRRISEGDYSIRLQVKTGDEIEQLASAINGLASDLQNAVKDINSVMGSVAEGDLSREVNTDLKGELDLLKKSINRSIVLLGETIEQTKNTNVQVNTGARELSGSAQSLADGTAKQAASLEEIASTLNEVDAQSKANNENASQARQLSEKTSEVVQRSDQQMQAMLKAMNAIAETATNISKIIKVIDEIAFQTNLLALNAAVEAARAGKYGKGFAVVAEEVRNLAVRSAEAAKNTTNLIENSVKEVANGVENADKTAKVLGEIKVSMTKLNDFIGEISAASKEQMVGIAEINKGLGLVNNVVQQNSSISEETASASDELTAQADQMMALMLKFKLRTEDRAAITPIQTPLPEVSQPKVSPQQIGFQHLFHPKEQRPKQIVLDDKEFGKY